MLQEIAIDRREDEFMPTCSCHSSGKRSCGAEGENGTDTGIKKDVIRLVIGLLFVASSFFMPGTQLKAAAYLCAYAVFGYDVLINLVKNALKGRVFDENFLMGIATLGAIALGEYPEAVGVMLFYGVGEFFQERAAGNSRRSIRALIGIKPDTAAIITEKGIEVVHPSEVSVGSEIIVKPGERIPLDGVLTEGKTSLDMSALTGESAPRTVSDGDEVLSGSINLFSPIKIRTSKSYSNSTVVRILEAVENVSSKKAPAERFITKFSRYYTPAVVLCAAIVSFVVPIVLGQPVSVWLHRGLVFLVVSCPCALVLSVPLGYFAGIGSCSRNGVLVKGGSSLDALSAIKTVVFDKTGTLTKGVFNVTEIMPAEGVSAEELLETAARIEAFSNHPIARSIVSRYGGEPDLSDISGFEEISGFGVAAVCKGEACLLGKAALLKDRGFTFDEYEGPGSVVYLSRGRKYAGYIAVSDEIKKEAADAVSSLNKMGIDTVMLTGDKAREAEIVAGMVGIKRVYSELLPVDKLERLEDIMKDGKTAFAGDGINDAPSLARADVSIAMGGLGQDAAIEASDVVIMNDNPAKIASAVITAKKVRVIVLQNIVFSLGIKAVFLSLGVLGMANMWMATFADVGVSLICVLNSMRGASDR